MGNRGRDRMPDAKKRAETLVALEIDGERITVDSRAITLRERQEMKRALADLPVEADEMDWVAAAAWITMRRSDPALTLDDVMDRVTVGDVQDREFVDAEADSPEA